MKKYTPFILILVSIGIFFFFIDPQSKEIQVLLEEKQENENMLEKARELREKREELNRRYTNITEEERETLKKVLPETVDNVRLIRDINLIANKYNMELADISITGGLEETNDGSSKIVDQTESQYGAITLGFSTTAPYDVFKSFLDDLEDSLRIVDINKLDIEASEKSKIYNYLVELDTYWLR